MKKLTQREQDAKYKSDQRKELAIAEMLGLVAAGYPYSQSVIATDKYQGQVFHNDLEGEDWYTSSKFLTDMNWQHEAITFVENLGYSVKVCKNVCEILSKDGRLNLMYIDKETKAESVFNALYLFATNDLIEK